LDAPQEENQTETRLPQAEGGTLAADQPEGDESGSADVARIMAKWDADEIRPDEVWQDLLRVRDVMEADPVIRERMARHRATFLEMVRAHQERTRRTSPE
jgi:hypothetical protein